MTNVIKHDFGFRNPEGYDVDNRFDLLQNALLMSVNWQIEMLNTVAKELYFDHSEAEMHKLVPLFEVMQAVYRDIVLPFTVTSDVGVRNDRTDRKNFSVTCFHYSIAVIQGLTEKLATGDVPKPALQFEVTYCDFTEDMPVETLFSESSVENSLLLPDPLTDIEPSIAKAILTNTNDMILKHGGFSRSVLADDGVSPVLIGFLPFSEVQYVRVSIVIPN